MSGSCRNTIPEAVIGRSYCDIVDERVVWVRDPEDGWLIVGGNLGQLI